MEVQAPSLNNIEIAKSTNDSNERIAQVFQLQQANLQALKNTSAKERKKKIIF